MTAKIVQLKPVQSEPEQEPRIWTCAHCGCQHFMLYEDGSTECALCEYRGGDAGGWIEQLSEVEDFDPNIPLRTNVPHGTADLARASVLKSVNEEAIAVAIVWPDGQIKLWAGFDNETTPEQREWFHRVMQVAAGLAFGEKATETGEMPLDLPPAA